MRLLFVPHVEAGRISDGFYKSAPGEPFGAFLLLCPRTPRGSDGRVELLTVMAADASELSNWWEHVSASHSDRCPSWEEMCWLKDAFWDEDEVVVQFHPAKRTYVNRFPYCLHLWRPTKQDFPIPPTSLVGPI